MSSALATPEAVSIVRPLFAEAREIYAQILDAEGAMLRQRDAILTLALELGRKLGQMKDTVGHGRWLYWLGANWPELGERNAQRTMALARDNPKSEDSTDLSEESVRKFMWGYIPAKERPQLDGNEKLSPVASFESVTNKFSFLHRRITQQHLAPPPLDVVAPQVRLIIDGLREIYGRATIDELLA